MQADREEEVFEAVARWISYRGGSLAAAGGNEGQQDREYRSLVTASSTIITSSAELGPAANLSAAADDANESDCEACKPGDPSEPQLRGGEVLRAVRFPLMSPAYLHSGRVQAALPTALAGEADALVREALAAQSQAGRSLGISSADVAESTSVHEAVKEPDLLGPRALSPRIGRQVPWSQYAASVGAGRGEAQAEATGAERVSGHVGCELVAATAAEAMAVAVSGDAICCGLSNGSLQASKGSERA